MTAGNGKTVTYTSFNMVNTITSGAYNYTYTYNAEHQRARLITVRPDDTITSIYAAAGFYEKETSTNTGEITHKFYVQGGAGLVGVQVIKSTGPPQGEMRYYHTDNLGSIATITNEVGGTLEQMAYELFGERRYDSGDPQDRLSPIIGITTDRGYTGHEHLDEMNLIHMNGRVFDPALGRFMTADPFIQHADNMQDYNRYGYCMNNPVICTDPSGYFSLKSFFRVAAAIAIAVFAPELIANAFTSSAISSSLAAGTLTIEGIAGIVATGNTLGAIGAGFLSGVVAGGSLESGLRGALTAGLFDFAGGIGEAGSFERLAAHAGAGCISGAVGGGGCGRGAASAVVGKLVTNVTEGWSNEARFMAASIAGGTASVIGGGKFANGAITSAFGYLFNCMGHECQNAFEPTGPPPEGGSRPAIIEFAMEVTGYNAFLSTMDSLVHGDVSGVMIGAVGVTAGSKFKALSLFEKHHLYPQKFESYFNAVGIEIDKHLVILGRETHKVIHGKGTGIINSWNHRWEQFIANNPAASTTPRRVQQYMQKLRKDFGI